MAYYSGTINYTLTDSARFTAIAAYSTAACVQCYVGGELVGGKIPAGGGVTFHVPHLKAGQYVLLLSVDAVNIETDYWDDAFSADHPGNRITIISPTQPGYLPGYLWRVYVDDTQEFERLVWPHPDSATCKIGGLGEDLGVSLGIETYGSGRGNWRGLQRGYEPVSLTHETPVKSPGEYELAVTVLDVAENETTQVESDLTHDTYPDEPENLGVSSYDSGTGELVLTFTESGDL